MKDSFELDINCTEVDITKRFGIEPHFSAIKFNIDDLHNPANEKLRVVLIEKDGISRSYVIRNHENFVIPLNDPGAQITVMFNKNKEELQKTKPHIRINFDLQK